MVLVNPSKAEVMQAQRRFNVHPLIVGDVLGRRQQPKFERFDEHLYVSLWDLNREGDDLSGVDTDLALIFNARELLLIQRGPDHGLRDLDALVGASGPVSAPASIAAVYRVLNAVVMDFVELGAEIEHDLEDLEAEVFNSRVREDYSRIYRLRQRIGRIDRAARGLAEALQSGQDAIQTATATAPSMQPYLLHLEHDANGVSELAAAEHLSLDAVVSSHESNVATRQNKDMRTISAFAALLAIPTVLAGLYGMNFKNLPLIDWEYGWVAVAVVVVATDLLAYMLFRHRGWLGGPQQTRHDGD
ncbi:CorA family divalent cation transporter [Microbacterium sp. A84]|uniref:CorA family divalent cation transporter n=1 Tax=Microbacterium sp. A84 TaxID=3450715 RepID=UPI003F41BC1A